MSTAQFVPLTSYTAYPEAEMEKRAADFRATVQRRRTVRDFSPRPIPRAVIEQCLLAAGTAPNGANLQPWHFVVISDPEVKHQIREAAEKEEHEFYTRRAPKEWLDALAPFGSNEKKPFLETAPCLIAIFALTHSALPDGRRVKNYYVSESVGIAVGILITALHHSGLVTLTHTPSPMGFLNSILSRPSSERPFLILVAGYPAEDAMVPVITKKPLSEIATFV
jgi:nitroreductase